MNLKDCHNFYDFRKLAKKKLPSPIFHYIDGAADDEITYKRNSSAFNDVDLVPNVLRGVENIDLSTTIFGKKLDLPFYLAPTALQRLFHYDGERAVGKAAQKFNTMFGVSALATVSVEEISSMIDTPKMFQFYFHKDRGLNDSCLERAKAAKFDVMALTVDTITGGNRERDLHTGFTSPPKLTLASLFSFATKPMWGINYLTKGKFELPHLQDFVKEGTSTNSSIGNYFSTMLDQSMNWKDAEKLCSQWGGHFALKGVMSVEDAKRALDIGCTGIMVSNHGGRQLDSATAAINALPAIRRTVGKNFPLIFDSGIRSGSDILRALAFGADFVMLGRPLMYAIGADGAKGLRRIINLIKEELSTNLGLVGLNNINEVDEKIIAEKYLKDIKY